MKQQRNVGLMMVIGLAFIASLWADPVSSAEQVKLPLQHAKGVEHGSGEAVFVDGTITARVKDLKAHSVYTVWYVNTDPKHEMAGVGQPPYMFKTDGRGAAAFKAKLDKQPFGTWQMLVIVRHPNGNPQDMQHMEDALWASLAKGPGKAAANPCAAKNPCSMK